MLILSMRINVSYSQYPALLDEFRQQQWITTHRDGKAIQTDWHSPFIAGYNRFFNLRSDLKIHSWNQTFLEKFELCDSGLEGSPVMLIFLLKGYLQTTYSDSTYHGEIEVKAGHNMMMIRGLGKQGN